MPLSHLGARFAAAVATLTVVGTTVAALPATPARPALARSATPAPQTWYLSLGDSLAIGVQPDARGNDHATRHGYADDLYTTLRAKHPGLRLAKLGCSGETTKTMISGGVCHYAHGRTQLTAALAFLREHRGHVSLVTLDIGANDILPCVSATGIYQACAKRSLAVIGHDLPGILEHLRAAAPGATVQLAGMDLYDPLLAAWYQGKPGIALAKQSLLLNAALNMLLRTEYRRAGFAVAPVAADYYTSDTTMSNTPACGAVPRDVAAICHLTWATAATPVGPDVHPNTLGYWAIESAFQSTLKAPLR